MRIEQRTPVTITHLRGPARRVHDVGEQHRGENPIIGHFGVLPGEELRYRLEGLAPRLHEVIDVAPRQLNISRAIDVIGDVLAQHGRDDRVVGVVKDERGHPDSREDRPHVQVGHQGHHGASLLGLAVMRSIRAHAARISSFHGMSGQATCW